MVFQITAAATDCSARCGHLSLPHGIVETPVFMPVGTGASVKAMHPETLEQMGYRLVLANTYHLALRPGPAIINDFRGVHRFSTWDNNLLTDSGGYQVFSLARLRKIEAEGIVFRSHLDGSTHRFTPESVVRLQESFGSDIQMALDVCTAPGIDHRQAQDAVDMTAQWLARAKDEWLCTAEDYAGVLFGITQGNFFADLRAASAARSVELDLPGYAVGGLSVGEPFTVYRDFVALSAELLPVEKPRYVMGIGTPDYIFEAVQNGVDMFDCVYPTRLGRTGTILTDDGPQNLKNERFSRQQEPICQNGPAARFPAGYLRHLFKSKEILAPMIATAQNLFFMQTLMRRIQESIAEDRFCRFKRSFLEQYASRKAVP